MPPSVTGPTGKGHRLKRAIGRLRKRVVQCARPPIQRSSLSRDRLLSRPSSAAGGNGVLPEDCLLEIVRSFANKQEAAVVRQVCRAWRDAFDSTVRRISIQIGLLPRRPPTSFAALQHLAVGHTSASTAEAAVSLLARSAAPTLVGLELSHCGLLQLPPCLPQLLGLRTLILSSGHLRSLPASLSRLPALEHLEICDQELSELPSTIGSLGGSVTRLVLSGNQLANIPESLGGLTGLVSLRVSNNLLTELPDSISAMQALTCLDVSLNRLKSLTPSLSRLTGLRQLGLYASFSHSLRNEGATAVSILAALRLAAPECRLHTEEAVQALVAQRVKQLQRAAEAAEAAAA